MKQPYTLHISVDITLDFDSDEAAVAYAVSRTAAQHLEISFGVPYRDRLHCVEVQVEGLTRVEDGASIFEA
jgi:hypothetical protein